MTAPSTIDTPAGPDRSKNRTNGRRGTDFERKVADALTTDGYLVIRAAGSHGAADLVAVKTGQVLFVQCKLNGRCDPPEWNEFHRLAMSVGALPIIAYRPGRQGIAYRKVTGPKDTAGARSPAVAWAPGLLAAVAS
jgi:Holliday junction resolvase